MQISNKLPRSKLRGIPQTDKFVSRLHLRNKLRSITTRNKDIVKLLRSVGAALTLKKGNMFQIRAYENAADAIEHSTSELKDLWEEKRLDEISGIGENLKGHFDELFKTGKVKHFEKIKKDFDPVIFEMLDISGVGPKTSLELFNLGVKSLSDLKAKIKSGELIRKGFSAKLAEKIISGLEELEGRGGRMLLPYANFQAKKILDYLKKSPDVINANPLGSLRRQVATIGDLDFAVSSDEPQKVADYFVKMPGVSRIIDQGENQAKPGTKKGAKASVVLTSGVQVDLLVGKEDSYGALLQHFTGSKHHNIKLRSYALTKGFSLSEYGVKKVQSSKFKVQNDKIIECKTEEDLYELLNMETPPPEIREDNGEIEAAIEHSLPKLVETDQIKGDLHTHSNFDLKQPSHAPGVNSIEEIVNRAKELNFSFVGISDHPPAFGKFTEEEIIKLIEKRTKYIQKINKSTKNIRVLNSLEIDILGNGDLSVPDESLKTLDYCIAGIHSGHRGTKKEITQRILKALSNPYVDILAHPTGRLLNERDSYEADWDEVFKAAAKNHKLLEINGYPNRLDLRDDLVKAALKYGVKFIINTDAHEISQMDNMTFGVSVARRGWAESKDIVNSWDWKDFAKWFKIAI